MNIKDLDLNNIWEDSFGWRGKEINPRKLDDNLEQEFWIKTAPIYTDKYNLTKDTPLLTEALAKRIAPGSTVLEIGPGSGNFTLHIAEYAKHITGVDFSAAMLEQLKKRADAKGYKHIDLINAKWEDFESKQSYDYIISINSLYRIKDMEKALLKMYDYCSKGIVLLRSIQRPYFYDLYKKLNIKCEWCWDYQLMPMCFWRRDISADVEFLNYEKKECFTSIESVEQELLKDLGRELYLVKKNAIFSVLKEYLVQDVEQLIYSLPRTTVVISVRK